MLRLHWTTSFNVILRQQNKSHISELFNWRKKRIEKKLGDKTLVLVATWANYENVCLSKAAVSTWAYPKRWWYSFRIQSQLTKLGNFHSQQNVEVMTFLFVPFFKFIQPNHSAEQQSWINKNKNKRKKT